MMVKSLISRRGFCCQNVIMVRFLWIVHFSTQQKWYYKPILEGWLFWAKLVHSVSINPALSTIKLLRGYIVCQDVAVIPNLRRYRPVRRHLIESIYWRLSRLYDTYLARPELPLREDGNEIDRSIAQIFTLWKSWSKDRADTAA